MRNHRRKLGSGPSLVKFRRKMFIAINKLDLPPDEQERERAKLREMGTMYRLPTVIRQRSSALQPEPQVKLPWWAR